ncbi:hypothetical protein ARMSODRAFT_1089341 [Armillaria solidipes]|uniref:DUF6534 domain-containing protein n=1 Tax=Armillaria solidipes TaxID=1076256 RepID=A0A2H3BDZ2_9AGAR|nr:hypothetical protein ARMSODRAFT_1089341 [Armillaria solidipes]
MTSQAQTTVLPLGITVGPLYIGSTIAAILFGVTNLQVVIYYKKYPDDWWVYRYSVGVLWVLDSLHVAFSTYAMYHYLVDLFGDHDGIYRIIWSFKLHMLLNMVIIVGVQAVYAIRIWKLGRHFGRILPWFVVLIATVAVGTGVFSIYDAYTISNFLLLPSIKARLRFHLIIGMNISQVPSRSRYVLSFLSQLWKSLRSPGKRYPVFMIQILTFNSTSEKLWSLMRLVVVSGLATSAWSLLVLITYLVWPNTLIFLGVNFILPKFYVNSLLVMLNCRRDHRPCTNYEYSEPKVLRFAPNDSGTDIDEVNINIPMNSVQSFDHAEDLSVPV